MSNNDEKKPGKIEYFELREKRLKLVYKVLYAVVAIWVTSIISIGGQDMTRAAVPIFALLLAVSSLITIIMIRYQARQRAESGGRNHGWSRNGWHRGRSRFCGYTCKARRQSHGQRRDLLRRVLLLQEGLRQQLHR